MLAAFAMTSCEDGLSSSSPSILTEEQVYSDPSLAEMGVLGIYETLTQQKDFRYSAVPLLYHQHQYGQHQRQSVQ